MDRNGFEGMNSNNAKGSCRFPEDQIPSGYGLRFDISMFPGPIDEVADYLGGHVPNISYLELPM